MRATRPRRLLSFKDASEETGLAIVTLRKWGDMRKIETVKLGRARRIPADEIDRLIASGTIPALPERSR